MLYCNRLMSNNVLRGYVLFLLLLLSILIVHNATALTTDEIINLKKAGVSDDVILEMIKKEDKQKKTQKEDVESRIKSIIIDKTGFFNYQEEVLQAIIQKPHMYKTTAPHREYEFSLIKLHFGSKLTKTKRSTMILYDALKDSLQIENVSDPKGDSMLVIVEITKLDGGEIKITDPWGWTKIRNEPWLVHRSAVR